MSRTVRGSKAAGYEYWSARPGNRHGGVVGPAGKRFTHQVERQQSRRLARHEVAATWLPGDAAPPNDGWDEFEAWEAEQVERMYQ